MVQSPGRPAMSWTKLASSLRAVGRVHHLGVEHARRRSARSSSAMMAKGAFSDVRDDLEALGQRVTRSPWLIQTW